MSTRSRRLQEPEQVREVALVQPASEGRPRISLESAEKILAAQTRWRVKNKDKIRTYQKKWRDGNREKVKAAHRKYQDAHKEKVKEWHRKSRQRQQAILKQAKELLAAQEQLAAVS